MGRPIIKERAKRPQEQIMGGPIMGVKRPKDASLHPKKSIHRLQRKGTLRRQWHKRGRFVQYAVWSSSNQQPNYDQVHRPESLWQLYYMEGYKNELETVDKRQHLGELRMKPPYQFGTLEEDQLARDYTKPDPNVLVIASNPEDGHRFLSQQNTNVVSRTMECIYDLSATVSIDSWGKTTPFPYESRRTAPDTSFDKHGTLGSAAKYQWYAKIEVACQNF